MNFFKGSFNLQTACIPDLREFIKSLISEKVYQIDLRSIIGQMTEFLTESQLRGIVENYISFQYGARGLAEESLIQLFNDIIVNGSSKTVYSRFFEKYNQIFFENFQINSMNENKKQIILFKHDFPDNEFDIFISVDRVAQKLMDLANE